MERDAGSRVIAEKQAARTDVQLAGLYFYNASEICPASVIGQGACIARYCKESGKNPQKLGDALLVDEKKMHGLSMAANKRHRDLGIQTAEPVTVEGMWQFVEGAFRYASKVMYLDEPELAVISTKMYAQFLPPDLPREQRVQANYDYNEAVEIMMFQKAIRDAAQQ